MAILTVRQLTKQYAGESRPALDHADLSIEKGEFVAVVGPSGSGKSTLLHLLGGIDKPISGQVKLYDTDIYALNQTQSAIFRRRQVGLIYQFYQFDSRLDSGGEHHAARRLGWSNRCNV